MNEDTVERIMSLANSLPLNCAENCFIASCLTVVAAAYQDGYISEMSAHCQVFNEQLKERAEEKVRAEERGS